MSIIVEMQTTCRGNKRVHFARALGLALVSSAISTGATLLFPFNVPNKLIFAMAIGALTFLMTVILFVEIQVKIPTGPKAGRNAVIAAAYAISILIISQASRSYSGISILSDSNPMAMLAGFLVSTLISAFLPGIAILEILGIREGLNRAEELIHSVLTSLLFSGLVGFAAWVSGDFLTSVGPSLLISHSVVLLSYLVHSYVKHRQGNRIPVFTSSTEKPNISVTKNLEPSMKSRHSGMNIDLLVLAIMLLLVIVLNIGYYTIHKISSTSPLPLLGDEYFHVGNIVRLMGNYFSWQEETLGVSASPYPYFFHLFMAVGTVASHSSVVDYYVLSALLLLPLPMATFFVLSRRITGRNKDAIFSTVIFQVSSGLGWVAAVLAYGSAEEITLIGGVSSITCDIIFSLWYPIIVAPYLIDIAVLFAVINLSLKKNLNSGKLVFLLTTTLLLSMLMHFEKAIVISMLGLAIAMIQVPFGTKPFRTKELGQSLIVAGVLVFLVDFIAPIVLYSSILLTATLLVIVAGSLMLIIASVPFEAVQWIQRLRGLALKNSWRILLLLAFLILTLGAIELGIQKEPLLHCAEIPLYFLPFKLGLPFVFLLIWAGSLRKHLRDKGTTLLLLVTVFASQVFLYHLLVPNAVLGETLDEFRFIRDVTWPVVALVSAAGLLIALHRISGLRNDERREFTRMVVSALLITIIMAPAMFSHLLKVEYHTAYRGYGDEDHGIAMCLEDLHVGIGASIYAPDSLRNLVGSITGVPVYTPQTPVYGPVLSGSEEASILYIIRYLNISFVIVKASDSASWLVEILEFFPQVYEDQTYRIHETVNFSHPSLTADTSIVLERPVLGESLESDLLWREDFDALNDWNPDLGTFLNVVNHSIEITSSGVINLEVEGMSGLKTVMMYRTFLDAPLPVEEDMYLWVKFRTDQTTKLLVHILYDDGTMSGARYGNTPYMNSEVWGWSCTRLVSNGKAIVGFRVGVTNKFDESTDRLLGEIDYMAIAASDNRYTDAIVVLSLTNVEYTVDFTLNSQEPKDGNNIITVEGKSNDTWSHLRQLAEQGKGIIIMGDLAFSGWASEFIDIELTGNSTIINEIEIAGTSYAVPTLNVTELSQVGGTVRAWYSSSQRVPLLIDIPVSSEAVVSYLNIWPLTDMMRELHSREDLSRLYHILETLLVDVLNFRQSDVLSREFYLKNSGAIMLEGHIEISCVNLKYLANDSLAFDDIDRECNLYLDGLVRVHSLQFGYLVLDIEGAARVTVDGEVILDSEFSKLVLLVKPLRVTGGNSLVFTSLNSGVPFQVKLSGERYEAVGPFDIEILPLASNTMLILPHLLTGFDR